MFIKKLVHTTTTFCSIIDVIFDFLVGFQPCTRAWSFWIRLRDPNVGRVVHGNLQSL